MIINGTELSIKVDEETKVLLQSTLFARPPGLCVILVGENQDSLRYIKRKEKKCKEFGISFSLVTLPATSSCEEVKNTIYKMNLDTAVDGIIMQMPLPKEFIFKNSDKLDVTRELLDCIALTKDIDGLSRENIGSYVIGDKGLWPATPTGIMRMFDDISYDLTGKHVVVIGRSMIVGKPIALMLLARNATVTIVHSHTKNIQEYTKRADVVISAVGKVHMVTKEMIAEGAVVIDVGMNIDEDGKLVGDVDFNEIVNNASYITPVPGGVGPLTVSYIVHNVVKAYICHNEKKNDSVS